MSFGRPANPEQGLAREWLPAAGLQKKFNIRKARIIASGTRTCCIISHDKCSAGSGPSLHWDKHKAAQGCKSNAIACTLLTHNPKLPMH